MAKDTKSETSESVQNTIEKQLNFVRTAQNAAVRVVLDYNRSNGIGADGKPILKVLDKYYWDTVRELKSLTEQELALVRQLDRYDPELRVEMNERYSFDWQGNLKIEAVIDDDELLLESENEEVRQSVDKS